MILIVIAGGIVAFGLFDLGSNPRIKALTQEFTNRFQGMIQLAHGNVTNRTKKAAPGTNQIKCRIQSMMHREGNEIVDALAIEICGTIHTPNAGHRAAIAITILDITDGAKKTKPVRAK